MEEKKEKSIFEKYMEKRNILIKNRNILQSSYIPEQLPHRDEQIKKIAEILAPCLNRDKPSNILIYGKTGTGKTAVLNYIGKELKKADPDEKNCSFIYVNCEVVDTPSGILYNISNQIITEYNRKIPFTGWALDKIYYELSNYIDEKDKVFIIVLDEIDRSFKKNGDDIFYFLTTMNEILKKSRVSIIGITNNSKFTELLSTKIKSRLGEEKIVFNPYNSIELQDILSDRAKCVFDEGVLDPAVIPYCAALSAQDSGDARKALDFLRIAADIAERNGDSVVTEAHVNSAREKIEFDAVIEVMNTITNQSKVVLMSIIKNFESNNKKMTTGDVYTTYREICDIIGMTPLTQRRVAGLISELDMLGIIHAQVKSLGRNGRTKEFSLNINQDIIDKFMKNELFQPLKNYKPSKQTTLM
jgi:cell division control protein 6